jgi:hypothetical protein
MLAMTFAAPTSSLDANLGRPLRVALGFARDEVVDA